ncbi:hypothetical protein Leryth_005796 [Lithospermum erythrorhizon]|nr:hypothetical protein Leryth_005796 [Lithospermum erythrorhizon]
MKTIIAKASPSVGLHFCKLREKSLKSQHLAFYVTFLEQPIESIPTSNIVLRERNLKRRNLVIYCTAQPEPQPLPPEPKQDPWWRNWTLGALLSVGLPFSTNKIDPMLRIRSEFATKLQTTEDMVEFIERGATRVEKVAEKRLEGDVTEDGVKRSLMVHIEAAAEKIAKKARSVDYIIDTIQDILLLESPDNDKAIGVYRDKKDRKGKAMEVDKEEQEQENDMKGGPSKADK